jgi:hypothetical protein
MDGLSAAASGIAVASLTIQLVDSIREILRFLHLVADAPKELKRLCNLLEQLELILESIRVIMEKQRMRKREIEPSITTSVLRAISTCKAKVEVLEDVVQKAKRAYMGSNKAAKSVGKLKLACKKKDIEDIETHLQHAVCILDLTMTMNLT